jgi:predicted ATPase
MLEKLKLHNFRCFEDYEIKFSDFNVIVGKNNTGKSTIVDALKLVANVCRFATYRDGYLKDRDIPFSMTNLRFDYREEDATVEAMFSDKIEIAIEFPVDGTPWADIPYNVGREKLRSLLGVVPPVGTFEETEKLADSKYLRSVMVSHLTPRHFRNIWQDVPEGFKEFQRIIQETWPGYIIERPETYDLNHLRMFFKENKITREIFWAGHGFQVWLQLMTFLVKLGRVETLVLDEPDIYLHSDMQKKLVNVCKDRSSQVIIATHAVDIIEEVEPECIIAVDKHSGMSRRLSDIEEVQTCITQLGSTQNLKLVHFYRGKTCLFVEGEDFAYLKKFANKLDYDSFIREDGFSHIPLGGFTNWDRLVDVPWIFKNAIGRLVKCYVILDRDYHTPAEISEIFISLKTRGVIAHVWEKKELENYAINFDALYRAFVAKFNMRHGRTKVPISITDFKDRLLSIFEEIKPFVLSQLVASRLRKNRSKDASTIMLEVMDEFESNWASIDYRAKVVSGKDFFSKLNSWLNSEYHISVSVSAAIGYLKVDEIDGEIRDVLREFTTFVGSIS